MSKLETIPVKVIVEPSPSDGTDTAASGSGYTAAILEEIAGLLEQLAQTGEGGTIDLRSLPMFPGDYERLQAALGEGEVSARVEVVGPSEVRETGIAGVWWIVHRSSDGEALTELIEVCRVPAILCTHPADIVAAIRRLRLQSDQDGGQARAE